MHRRAREIAIGLLSAVLWGGILPAAAAAEADSPALLLELDAAPAAAAWHASLTSSKAGLGPAAKAAQQRLAEIERDQQAILRELSAKHGTVTILYRCQRVCNGIAVRASQADAAELATLPGVKAVHRLRRMRVDVSTSVPFLGIPALWDVAGLGLTGRGVTIGVIDTGIDYLHPGFGGLGNPADHARNDLAALGDVPFPTPKVVGGYDFVGDRYDPGDRKNNVPFPDPDPMDQLGHGTNVASIAAGSGISSNGLTYAGTYDAATPFLSMQVGPGAAPEADLYALKIFGATNESDIIIPAIEWSADPNGDGDFSDHLDVINLSLGDSFGAADTPEAIACDLAAQVGVIVVASAGNNRDAYFATGSPGASAWALSVAASEDTDPAVSHLSPDRLAYFSSRGPAGGAGGGVLLKPDAAAPGNYIRSAAAYAVSPSALSQVKSGTSMAAPQVAGGMALLRELHPDWPVADLKALLMTTAVFDLYSGPNQGEPRHGPQRAGSGRIDLARATRTEIIAFDAAYPERVGITFETREVLDTVTETRTLRVLNKSALPAAYAVSLDTRTLVPGADVTVALANTGEIPPGGYADLEITLSARAADLKHARDPAADVAYLSNTRAWISELAGYVTLSPGGSGDGLRIPFYATLRPASDLLSSLPFLDARPGGDSAVMLDGRGVRSGSGFPADTVSLGSAFELLYASPVNPALDGPERAADLRFVGISSDYAAQDAAGKGIEETTLYLAIATHGSWFSPHWVRFLVYIDATGDGRPDYSLYNSFARADVLGEGPSPDVFASILDDFSQEGTVQGFLNSYTAAERDTVPFMTEIMVLPLRAADLGLEEDRTVISFHIESMVATDLLEALDQAPAQRPGEPRRTLSYDLVRPGIDVVRPEARPLFETEAGTLLPLRFDAEAYAERGAIGLLLFHHHNRQGAHAEWLPVITAGDTDQDGIPDAVEGAADPDQDGLPNLVDPDSDGDGIPDADEGTEDPDEDGTPNYLDLDSDGDGIPDAIEGAADFDADGFPNYLDVDADGDGIPDRVEGTADPDNDGAPNFLDLDSDGDQIPDQIEGLADIDGDGLPNYLDLDSDGDTLVDSLEAQRGSNPYDPDSDNDGIPDHVEGLGDADHDGIINALDDDSDGDGIPDAVEGTGDPDLDKIPNFLDPDSDGDGIPDAVEGIGDPDRDGIPNFLDLDSDGDTLSDKDERSRYGTDPYHTDTDRDGFSDDAEVAAGTDPTRAEPPPAPSGVSASGGTFSDRVQISWDPLPGLVEYRVMRAESPELDLAIPLIEEWQTDTVFDDVTASPPRQIPGRGCHGPSTELVLYTYWVQARTAPAGFPPTSPGPPSAPDQGYRKP